MTRVREHFANSHSKVRQKKRMNKKRCVYLRAKSDYVYDIHKTNVCFKISIQSHCHKPFIGLFDIEKLTRKKNIEIFSHHRLRQ